MNRRHFIAGLAIITAGAALPAASGFTQFDAVVHFPEPAPSPVPHVYGRVSFVVRGPHSIERLLVNGEPYWVIECVELPDGNTRITAENEVSEWSGWK